MSTGSSLDRQTLTNVINKALRLQSLGYGPSLTQRPATTLHYPVEFCLPSPQPIVRSLFTRGFNQRAAEVVSNAYLCHADRLRSAFEATFRDTARTWIQTNFGRDISDELSKVRTIYTHLYSQTLRRWVDALMARKPDSSHRVDDHQTRRSSFNQALPILERAFSLHPYPTRQDKSQLAEETGMELKQISIWFQNRRNRSKKTHGRSPGRIISMRPTSQGRMVSEETTWSVYSIHSAPTAPPPNEPSSASTQCAFADTAPPHAFPTPYPPVCDYEPFPSPQEPAGRIELPWPRASSVVQQRFSPVDVDELTRMLERLTIDITPKRDEASVAQHNTCASQQGVIQPSSTPLATRDTVASTQGSRPPSISGTRRVQSPHTAAHTPEAPHRQLPSSIGTHSPAPTRSTSMSSLKSVSSNDSSSSTPDSPLPTPPMPSATLPSSPKSTSSPLPNPRWKVRFQSDPRRLGDANDTSN